MTSPEPVDRTPPGQPADLVYNPYAFEVHEDPYALYRRMRDEAPAYWNDELEFWALSRFADVEAAFKDHETFSSALGVALESRRQPGALPMMITMDPPEHTVLRKLVSRVFTPRGWRPWRTRPAASWAGTSTGSSTPAPATWWPTSPGRSPWT
jgi:cytochrome P450